MNQQIQKRQASALDRAKAALAHGAHAIDSSDVSELIQDLEKLLAEREADAIRLEWLASNSVEAVYIFARLRPGREKFIRSGIDYHMQQHAAQGGGVMLRQFFVRNACECRICGAPADRHGSIFQCQKAPGHIADTMTGIFSDLSWPSRVEKK